MAYRFKLGRSIEREMRRIADKQLALAIARMRKIGDPKSDEAVHEARRHVKKVRALIRLVQPALGRFYCPSNQHLSAVNRLLAPIADGEAVVDTLARLQRRYRRELPRHMLVSMRKALVRRWTRADEEAKANHVLQAGVAVLRAERERAHDWTLNRRGFRAVERGLRKSVKGARRAMALAMAYPTIDHYHSWRRRVKDHWFQVRLLQGRCADELVASERGLEALDDCLGEYHNTALLQAVLVSDALLPRADKALTLRILRRYQSELRRRTQELGMQLYSETPRRFVKRVRRVWRKTGDVDGDAASDRRASWGRAA